MYFQTVNLIHFNNQESFRSARTKTLLLQKNAHDTC